MAAVACNILPELEGSWDWFSIKDLAFLTELCVQDASFFRPLLVARRVAMLSERLRGDEIATSEGSRRRAAAADDLGTLGVAAVSAVPELCSAALTDEDKFVCFKAIRALGRLGAASRLAHAKALPQLLELLADEDDDMRRWALDALVDMNVSPTEAIPCVAELIAHADAGLRATSLELLAKLRPRGAHAEEAAHMLAAALGDEDVHNRVIAVAGLGELGGASAFAAPRLAECLSDSDADVRDAAAQAVLRLGEARAVVPELLLLASRGNKYGCYQALAVVGRLGSGAAFAVPQLMSLLDDEDADVRSWATEALPNIGGAAAAVVPKLRELHALDPDMDVRVAAKAALDRLSAAGA